MEFKRFEDFQMGLRKDREGDSKVPPPGRTPENSGVFRINPSLSLSLSLKKEVKKKEGRKEEEKKITFNRQIKDFINIEPEDIERWMKTYKLVNVLNELAKMVNWLLANPTRRYKNYHSFIVRWLSREEEKLKRQESLKGEDPKWMKRVKEEKKK